LKRESMGLSSPMASASRIWSPMARMDSMAPGGRMLFITSSMTPGRLLPCSPSRWRSG
jgi:hypothetical protein